MLTSVVGVGGGGVGTKGKGVQEWGRVMCLLSPNQLLWIDYLSHCYIYHVQLLSLHLTAFFVSS